MKKVRKWLTIFNTNFFKLFPDIIEKKENCEAGMSDSEIQTDSDSESKMLGRQ